MDVLAQLTTPPREKGKAVPYGQRLPPQFVDTTAAKNPEQIFGIMPKSANISQGLIIVTMKDLAHGANYQAHSIDKYLGRDSSFSTIAYIGPSDFRYYISQLGAMKSGHPLLMFSPRNAPINNVTLFQATDCRALFYAAGLAPLAEDLAARIPGLRIFPVSSLEEMIRSPVEHYPYTKTWEEAKDETAIIVHTSGSTGPPKPIGYSNAFLGCFDAHRLLPDVDGRATYTSSIIPNTVRYAGLPIFHAGAVILGYTGIFGGHTLVLGPAEAPMDIQAALQMMQKVEASSIIMVPAMIETLCTVYQKEFLSASKTLKFVYWAGGMLSPFQFTSYVRS
jgi:acyl-CoA synthetase (AMP-forming)/AMP-acid ligase II